jgi:hypothetical protein
MSAAEPLNLELLDDEDPFEIDEANRPICSLMRPSAMMTLTMYGRAIRCSSRQGLRGADWLMVAEVPGGDVLVVPLAKPNSGQVTKARPIGIYRAAERLKQRYLEER